MSALCVKSIFLWCLVFASYSVPASIDKNNEEDIAVSLGRTLPELCSGNGTSENCTGICDQIEELCHGNSSCFSYNCSLIRLEDLCFGNESCCNSSLTRCGVDGDRYDNSTCCNFNCSLSGCNITEYCCDRNCCCQINCSRDDDGYCICTVCCYAIGGGKDHTPLDNLPRNISSDIKEKLKDWFSSNWTDIVLCISSFAVGGCAGAAVYARRAKRKNARRQSKEEDEESISLKNSGEGDDTPPEDGDQGGTAVEEPDVTAPERTQKSVPESLASKFLSLFRPRKPASPDREVLLDEDVESGALTGDDRDTDGKEESEKAKLLDKDQKAGSSNKSYGSDMPLDPLQSQMSPQTVQDEKTPEPPKDTGLPGEQRQEDSSAVDDIKPTSKPNEETRERNLTEGDRTSDIHDDQQGKVNEDDTAASDKKDPIKSDSENKEPADASTPAVSTEPNQDNKDGGSKRAEDSTDKQRRDSGPAPDTTPSEEKDQIKSEDRQPLDSKSPTVSTELNQDNKDGGRKRAEDSTDRQIKDSGPAKDETDSRASKPKDSLSTTEDPKRNQGIKDIVKENDNIEQPKDKQKEDAIATKTAPTSIGTDQDIPLPSQGLPSGDNKVGDDEWKGDVVKRDDTDSTTKPERQENDRRDGSPEKVDTKEVNAEKKRDDARDRAEAKKNEDASQSQPADHVTGTKGPMKRTDEQTDGDVVKPSRGELPKELEDSKNKHHQDAVITKPEPEDIGTSRDIPSPSPSLPSDATTVKEDAGKGSSLVKGTLLR
ncbi:protein starmaker-like [Ptychodera flava]|uniref:protein starmaker-like n=1 Tax=Ptychodera flava TaxID=63121 RepID=UPI00396A9CE0